MALSIALLFCSSSEIVSSNRIVVVLFIFSILSSLKITISNSLSTSVRFFEIESFSEGLAVVKKRKPDYGFAWGAVDVNGNVIIPVEYDYLGACSEGLINFQKEKKSGFIDKTNKIIIPAMYDNFSGFSDGLAAVKISETGKYGYIDKNNNLVIAAQYEDANPFYGGFAAVAKKKGYTMK